eukprot:TRINITY_DN2055_c0_g1_i1.p1 TRINITY_DN2055_c0_g1~~TRINITY_DN2055_c0_g1_i1.p1  ORF type:complete len:403 (+),score=171.96 TRINITY_DN2055_c0_g1_i1:59-1210(+)
MAAPGAAGGPRITQVDPVDPIDLTKVQVPEQFKKVFELETTVHLWCVVTKMSHRREEQQRVLVITQPLLFLCMLGGRVTRVLRAWEIEKVFIQNYQDKRLHKPVQVIVIKSQPDIQEPSLVLRLSAHPFNRAVGNMPKGVGRDGQERAWELDPLVPVRVLNEVRKKYTGTELPVYVIEDPAFDVQSSGQFGPFTKGSSYRKPKEKLKDWDSEAPRSPREEPREEPPPQPGPMPPPPPPQRQPPSEPEEPELGPVVAHQPHFSPPQPPPAVEQEPLDLPAEPMVLIPTAALDALSVPPPVVYRRRKPREACGAPCRVRQQPDSIHLRLYMHRAQQAPAPAAPLLHDDVLPTVAPVARSDLRLQGAAAAGPPWQRSLRSAPSSFV